MAGNMKCASRAAVLEDGMMLVGCDQQRQQQRESDNNLLKCRRTSTISAVFNRSMTTASAASSLSLGFPVYSETVKHGSDVDEESNNSLIDWDCRSFGSSSSVAHLVRRWGYVSGWARKLSPHCGIGWQKRYFCLLEGDVSLAYWRSVPEYDDEQPKGSINLKEVYSVELDGALGIVLQTALRDYRLMFNVPSEKDQWYNRILGIWRAARKRIDDRVSEAVANKFASWAYAQQPKSSTGFSTLFNALRLQHAQLSEWSVGMGPTTDQVDIKKQLLHHFLLDRPLQQAFNEYVLTSFDYAVPLESYVPDVRAHDVEKSLVYSYAFAMNVYCLYNQSCDLKHAEQLDNHSSGSSLCSCSYGGGERQRKRVKCAADGLDSSGSVPLTNELSIRQQQLSSAHLNTSIGDASEHTQTHVNIIPASTPSNEEILSHINDRDGQAAHHATATTAEHHQQRYFTPLPLSGRTTSSSSSSSSSICSTFAASDVPFYSTAPLCNDDGSSCELLSRASFASASSSLGSSRSIEDVATTDLVCVSCRTTPLHCSLPIIPPLRRSASLSSLRAEALKYLRFAPRHPEDAADQMGSQMTPQTGRDYRLIRLRRLLGLRRDQARTWKFGLQNERAASVDASDLTDCFTRRRLCQASTPLFPNLIGLAIQPTISESVGWVSTNDTDHYWLRPVLPGETQALALRVSVPMASITVEMVSEFLRRSIMGTVDDLVRAEQLCRDLDGISRLSDELSVGTGNDRRQQHLARCLYERSTPSAMHPLIDCLLGSKVASELEPASWAIETSSHPARSKDSSSSYPVLNSSCMFTASSRPSAIVKAEAATVALHITSHMFLDNILLGRLDVSLGFEVYTPYLALLVSSVPVCSGKCFELRRPTTHNDVSLPDGYSMNSLHLYTMDVVDWPVPSNLPPRTVCPSPAHVIELPKCQRISLICESDSGFEWTCKQVSSVSRRFHEGMKQRICVISLRTRTEREANMFRQSMISSKLASLSITERSRVLRAWYKGHSGSP